MNANAMSIIQVLKFRCRREGCSFEFDTDRERRAHESHHAKRGPYPETATCMLCVTDIPMGKRTEHLKTEHGIQSPKGGCNKYYLSTDMISSPISIL